MIVFYGALGAIMALGLFALGVFLGWKAHIRFGGPRAEPVPDKELRRMQAQQEAFRELQHYSAETAYGIGKEAVR